MVHDLPFFASIFDGFGQQTVCSGGGGRGTSKTDCTTDGGDTRRGTGFVASIQDAAARTTARIAVRQGDEPLDDVARRFGREGDVAIDAWDLRFSRPIAMAG